MTLRVAKKPRPTKKTKTRKAWWPRRCCPSCQRTSTSTSGRQGWSCLKMPRWKFTGQTHSAGAKYTTRGRILHNQNRQSLRRNMWVQTSGTVRAQGCQSCVTLILTTLYLACFFKIVSVLITVLPLICGVMWVAWPPIWEGVTFCDLVRHQPSVHNQNKQEIVSMQNQNKQRFLTTTFKTRFWAPSSLAY